MPTPPPYGTDTNSRLAVLESNMAGTARQLDRVEHEMDSRFNTLATRLDGAMAEMRAGAAEGRRVLVAILASVIGTLVTTIVGILIATA